MYILGISAFYHDSSAALIRDGKIIAAAQEERFSRRKNDSSFPKMSILYCLKHAQITPEQIHSVVFYEKPFLKFERILETFMHVAPRGFSSFVRAIPLWVSEKLFQKKILGSELEELKFPKRLCREILFSEHHLSHAASAFYPSPFKDAIVLTMDGVGEWDTLTIYLGKDNSLKKMEEISYPNSLGLLYSAFTYYCGFKVNSGEYKLMGLAPYGRPIYSDIIKEKLIDLRSDGSFCLNMDYFNFSTGLTMTNNKFDLLFGKAKRNSDEKLQQIHMDLAASIQVVLEEIVLKICRYIRFKYSMETLCLAGGVALNCVANGKILEEKIFENIWVQPASGDAGGSLGAALAAHHLHFKNNRNLEQNDGMSGSYLGPEFSNEEIEEFLRINEIVFSKMNENEIVESTAQAIANGSVVGWFQGRMEFGPRALGHRSILADPRSHQMQKQLNLKIKFRESFRPFAPAVLEERASEWFKLNTKSPYMLFTANILDEKKFELTSEEKKLFGIDLLNCARSSIPAVTHVDYSARIQTVSKITNPLFHRLIESFYLKTDCPILINTSFNVRGEPIVCTPKEAVNCFFTTEIDILVLGSFFIEKSKQTKSFNFDRKLDLD